MDLTAFSDYMIAGEGCTPETAAYLARRLSSAIREGFDAPRFASNPTAATESGRAYLASIRSRGPIVYNNHAKALNALARHLGHPVRFPLLRVEPPPPSAYTPTETAELLAWGGRDQDHQQRTRALIRWLLATGTRRSETARLLVQDLDLNHGTALIRPGKGGRRRRLPLPPNLLHPNSPFTAWLRNRPTPTGHVWTRTVRAVPGLPSRPGPQPSTPAGLAIDLWRVGKDLGFPVSFNRFRHTRATTLLRGGVDVRYIQVWLGHQKLETTARYAEVTHDDLEKAVRNAW